MGVYALTELFPLLDVPGPDLLLRNYGRQAFPVIEGALLRVPVGDSLHIDFAGISVMDTSFADETILQLALGLTASHYGDRFLVLNEPSQATIDNLEGTIARRKAKIALLVRHDKKLSYIGHLEANLASVWQIVHQTGQLTARQLADQLGLEINTASMRLRKLYDGRLLRRHEEVSAEGRQHVYRLPA